MIAADKCGRPCDGVYATRGGEPPKGPSVHGSGDLPPPLPRVPPPPTAFARAAVFLATPGCAPPSPRRPRHPCLDGNSGALSLVHRFTQARRGTRSCCASVPATSCAADRSEQEASVRSGVANAGKFTVVIYRYLSTLSLLSSLSSPSSSSSLHRVALRPRYLFTWFQLPLASFILVFLIYTRSLPVPTSVARSEYHARSLSLLRHPSA